MIFILIYHLQGICCYHRILWFINHFRMRSIPFEFKWQCVNDVFNYLLNETFPFGLSCFSNQIMNWIGVYFWWPRKFFIDIWGGADWEQRTVQEPPTESLVEMLTLVPKNNNFTFDGNHYLQINGTAMGIKMAPSYANIFMGDLEERLLLSSLKQLFSWFRFIDDVDMK